MSPSEAPNAALSARAFGAGPLCVEISCDGADLVERYERLFAAMPDPPSDCAATVVVSVRAVDDGYETHIDGQPHSHSPVLSHHDTAIASRLNRLVLDHECDLLHLHAGVVALGGAGVLLIGATGSGKSTITAHLARSGWTYLTDEMTAVERDPCQLRAYPRPLTLKRGSWHLFPELDDLRAVVAEEPVTIRVEVPPAAFGASVGAQPVAPSLIACVQWVDTEPSAESLTPTEALFALIADSVDLERAGLAGMELLVELAASVPAVRLETSELDRTEALLVETLDSAGARREGFRYIAPAPERGLTAHAWEFTDTETGIIHNITTGVTVGVDAHGLAVWEAMAETSTTQQIASAVGAPVDATGSIAEFVASLAALDMVTDRADPSSQSR